MADRATCRSCGAAIVWVVMYPSGKRMPLDAKPEKRVRVELGEPPTGHVVDAFLSHFVTCPNAAQHRKPKLPGVE